MFNLKFFLSADVAEIQKLTRESLERKFKNALLHDWIPRDKAKTFSVKDFYVELKWTRTVKGAIRNTKTRIKSLHAMFNFTTLGQKRTNILVEGRSTIFFNSVCGSLL